MQLADQLKRIKKKKKGIEKKKQSAQLGQCSEAALRPLCCSFPVRLTDNLASALCRGSFVLDVGLLAKRLTGAACVLLRGILLHFELCDLEPAS